MLDLPMQTSVTNNFHRKYNTLTTADAHLLRRQMAARTRPMRTASVLQKIRAPPITATAALVSNPDTDVKNDCRCLTPPSANKAYSTTQVIQNKLSSLKNLFRFTSSSKKQSAKNDTTSDTNSSRVNKTPAKQEESCKNINLFDKTIDLNASLSPSNVPSPPSALKSISYLESNGASVHYSNYDDFTTRRNNLNSSMSISRYNRDQQQQQQHSFHRQSSVYDSPKLRTGIDVVDNNKKFDDISIVDILKPNRQPLSLDTNSAPWCLSSLPPTSNLTTVLEERNDIFLRHKHNYFIQPPASFANPSNQIDNRTEQVPATYANGSLKLPRKNLVQSDSSSSQSFSSITTDDSALDCHRKAIPYRFSYAQDLQVNKSATKPGLLQEILKNGQDKNSLEAKISELTFRNLDDNDLNNTLTSDTSTLQENKDCGESATTDGTFTEDELCSNCNSIRKSLQAYESKLKVKEKELRDLQLEQLSSAYLVDQLRASVNSLEKENARLKAAITVSNNNIGQVR